MSVQAEADSMELPSFAAAVVLAGGVVITSLRSELPDGLSERFWPFCLGAAVFAIFLLMA